MFFLCVKSNISNALKTEIRFLTYLYMFIFISQIFSDFILMKRFCEDVLRIIHQLEVGECSLKGFLAHKLYETRTQLRQLHSQHELNEYKSESNISVWSQSVQMKLKEIYTKLKFFVFFFSKRKSIAF